MPVKKKKCILCGEKFLTNLPQKKICRSNPKCLALAEARLKIQKAKGQERYKRKCKSQGLNSYQARRSVQPPPRPVHYNPSRFCNCGCGLELYRPYRFYLPGHLELKFGSHEKTPRCDGDYAYA